MGLWQTIINKPQPWTTTYFGALHMQAVFHATDYSGKKLSVIAMHRLWMKTKQYETYAHIMAYEINDTLLLWICSITKRKNRAFLNFARFDSLMCIVARSRENSGSLSLVTFLARCRSLSLPGLVVLRFSAGVVDAEDRCCAKFWSIEARFSAGVSSTKDCYKGKSWLISTG